jgi:uncharacterized protein YndB with AHSA1/START domain
MTWILVVALAVLVLFLVAANVAGSRLPRDHQATARARYRQPPEKVWHAVTNMPDAPNWRSGLRRVERHADFEGNPVWVEVRRQGRMPLVFEAMEPPRRLVMRIADEKLPVGGTWTCTIVPEGDGCTLSITEEGFIRSRFMRFWARYVSGYDGTIRRYLRDLGRKLGEKSTPDRRP